MGLSATDFFRVPHLIHKQKWVFDSITEVLLDAIEAQDTVLVAQIMTALQVNCFPSVIALLLAHPRMALMKSQQDCAQPFIVCLLCHVPGDANVFVSEARGVATDVVSLCTALNQDPVIVAAQLSFQAKHEHPIVFLAVVYALVFEVEAFRFAVTNSLEMIRHQVSASN